MRRPRLLSGAVTPWVDNFPRGSLTPQEEAAVQARVDGIIGHESKGNPRAQNPRSTAGGLGQFINDTWLQYARKVNPSLRNATDMQVLSLKKDASPQGVAFQRQVLNDFTRDNAIKLKNAGLPINAATLYSVHFSGGTDLAKAAATGSRATVGQILGGKAARANPTLAHLSAPAFMQRFGKEPGGTQIARNEGVDPSRSPVFNKQFGGAPAPIQTAAASPAQLAQPRLDPMGSQGRPATTLLEHLSPVSSAVAAPQFQPPPPRPAAPSAQLGDVHVGRNFGPPTPPPPAQLGDVHVGRNFGPPQPPMPQLDTSMRAPMAPRAMPASMAGAPQPQIQPAARPQAQLGPMHVGAHNVGPTAPPPSAKLGDMNIGRHIGPSAPPPSVKLGDAHIGRNIGPAAPAQAPLPQMANNTPRAMPASMAGAPQPKITPAAAPAPVKMPTQGAPSRFSGGGELRGEGDAAFRKAYQESLQRGPAPVSAPPATPQQIAQPKLQPDVAPPGTHYRQFGPNKILFDDKTGATVSQLNGWEHASPIAKQINGYDNLPAQPPAPQPRPRPEYADPNIQKYWENRPPYGVPGVTPQVPNTRDIAATPTPGGARTVQLPPMDVGRIPQGPGNGYQPLLPNYQPMTPDPTVYQPVTTPISTPAVDPTVFSEPAPVSIPSTDPGPTFTPDPGPSMGDSMPTVGAEGGDMGGGMGDMLSGLAEALGNLGGGGEGGGGGQMPNPQQGLSPLAAMASVPDFPRIGDQYAQLLNQRGAQVDAPIGLPQTPGFNLKQIGQAGQQPDMNMEGFAHPALKRLFTA